MFRKIKVKPGKQQSLLGFFIGIVFVFIGIMIVIPTFGLFGLFWTIIALTIAVSNGYNAFSEKGISSWEVSIDSTDSTNSLRKSSNTDFEEKLRKLQRLKEDGLLSEKEFQRKREEILDQKW